MGGFPTKRRYATQAAEAVHLVAGAELVGDAPDQCGSSASDAAAVVGFAGGPVVYWERQGADCLCAVHCLNALLQGPHFTAASLGEIAQELDREECKLCTGRMSPSGRGNVDARGNFSSQVLFRALQRWGDMSAVDSRHEDIRAQVSTRPELETGYICNVNKHWVALRKVPWSDGKEAWFNLNSLCATGPTEMGDSWLASFLASASSDKDTVFVVRGHYTLPNPEAAPALAGHQMFLDAQGVQRLREAGQCRQAAEVRQAAASKHALHDGFDDPPALPGQVQEPWKVVWSDTEAAYYFWNTWTGVTQWEHPAGQVGFDANRAMRLVHLGQAGAWQAALAELAPAESSLRAAADATGSHVPCRYVDYAPLPHGRSLLHLATEQGQALVVQRLLRDFGASPTLATPEGFTATDIAWVGGHAAVLGALMAPSPGAHDAAPPKAAPREAALQAAAWRAAAHSGGAAGVAAHRPANAARVVPPGRKIA